MNFVKWVSSPTCHISNALWKQWEEAKISTAELKMVHGEEFIFKDTLSQILSAKDDYKKCLKVVNQTIINLVDRVSTILR
jgi:hypothetical protein